MVTFSKFLDFCNNLFTPKGWPKAVRRVFIITLPVSLVVWMVLSATIMLGATLYAVVFTPSIIVWDWLVEIWKGESK